jgi:hypothetical protein
MGSSSSGPRLYRVLKTLDAAYCRVHRHPVFHIVVENSKRIGIVLALAIPLLVVTGIAYKRAHSILSSYRSAWIHRNRNRPADGDCLE